MGGIGETARLIAELDLKDNFSKGIGSATRSLSGLQSSLGRMGRGVGQIGAGLATLGTRAALLAAGGLTAVVTTAASFEQAFTGVEKTVEGTDAQLAELEQTLRQMARTMPVSFEELSAIGEAGGALGIARDDLDEFIDIVARLSVSTNLSADSAATALGQLSNVLGLSGAELHDFADSLVALGNAGASTESQIVEVAARFGAAGRAAGLSAADILALASTTASMGIEVEAAGGSLSRLFNQVATNIGTSSAKAEVFAKALGLSAAEFREAWGKDALGTFNEFLEKLSTLDQFEAAALLKEVGITATRDVNAIRTLAQGFDELQKQIGISRGQTDELNEESQKFFDTAIGQWKTLRNNVSDAAATIGTELLPITKDLLDELIAFIQKPGSQAGLKQFGKDLAESIRGVVKELKEADFSGFISTLKIIADAGKKVVDIFLSLPPGIQAAIVTGAAINKLSGGLLGAGAGNIIGGAGSLFFDRFLARGSGPHNPVWVQSGVGGVGGLPVAGGFSSLLLLGPFIAAGITGGLLGAAAAEAAPAPFGGTKLRSEEGAEAMRNNTSALDDNTTALTNLGQFDPKNFGGTPFKKGIFGDPKAGVMKLPDTALSPGGTAIKLPDTAMSALTTTATETKKLPPILTRQEIAAQTLNAKLAATVPKGQARPDLSVAIVGAVQNSSSASNAWSARQLAAFAQGTAAQRTTAGKAGEIVARSNELRAAIGRGFGDLGGAQRQVAARVAEARNAINVGNSIQRIIAGKIGPPTVLVKVINQVTISEIQRKITSQQIAVGKGPLESF